MSIGLLDGLRLWPVCGQNSLPLHGGSLGIMDRSTVHFSSTSETFGVQLHSVRGSPLEHWPRNQKVLNSILVTSIFSFFHNILKRLLSQTRQKVSLCGNGLSYCQVRESSLSYSFEYWSMDECNTILSAYTKYRHLG